MTWNNPHPLANPFNQREHGNVHIGHAMQGKYFKVSRPSDPKTLEVPNQDVPFMGDMPYNAGRSDLTVPNQDIPLGDQLNAGSGGRFMPGHDNIFITSDGTVLDFKAHKILRLPHEPDPHCWGDPNKTISMDSMGVVPTMNNVHRDIPLEELINNVSKYAGTAMPDGTMLEPMDPRSAAYWLKAREETDKLMSSMTDAQKKMIADFEAHFPKSRLIDEAKKAQSGDVLRG